MADRHDMTVGSEWKQILLFSLPIMLGQFLQQLYNTVDGIVVSNFAGATNEACEAALAAVGGCVSLIFLFLAVSIGLGNGGAVLVAQLYGARRMDELRRAASTLLITLGVLGAALAAVGFIFAKPMVVGLMGVKDPNISGLAIQYFAIYSLGLIFQYIYNAVAAILRAIGDSRATLYFLIVSAGLNTALDLLFVIKFGWGVAGVAIATVIAQAASAVVSVVYMVKKYEMFRYKKGEFVFDKEKFAISIKLGVPAMIQQAVISLGNVFLQRLVNSFGQATMSAFTVGNRMEAYAQVPIFGLNIGVATFTGQNVGACRYDRAKRGWKYGTIMAVAASVVIATVLFTGSHFFTGLFNLTGEAMERAVEFIDYVSFCMVIFAAYIPTAGLLQGSGDVIWPTITSLASLTLRIVMSYGLVYFLDFGYSAVWFSMPFGWALGILILYPRYFSGKWMTKSVVRPPLETGEEGLEE